MSITRASAVVAALGLSGGILGAAEAASGCSASACVPRTGSWSAPSPQKLTSRYGPTALTFKVRYRRSGKYRASTYGNTVTDFAVYLRYDCPDTSSAVWVETGFATQKPITLKRDGTVRVKVPAYLGVQEHRLSLRFKRTTFTGRLSGSAKNSEGVLCSTSVSFSGKRK